MRVSVRKVVLSLAIDAEDYLYAGPWGYSLYKTTTSTVTSVEDLEFEPTLYYLGQNYPNPFNPTTSIQYAIASRQFVTLNVYDVLGNEVTTLVNEEKPVGTYELNWNAANLPSGVYFYRLQVGSFVQTRKMILLK